MSHCTLVVADGARILASYSEDLGVGHAEKIAPFAQDVMKKAGLAPKDITQGAATIGPGSFMGARVGVSFIKGFCAVYGRDTLPITSFAALRVGVPELNSGMVLIDARRGQVYGQAFSGDVFTQAFLMDYEAARHLAAKEPSGGLVGSGVAVLFEGQKSAGPIAPSPDGLVRAAAVTRPGPLTPFYLRAPDAKRPAASA